MERGTAVPASAGGLRGKAYSYSPHHRIDQMQATFGGVYDLDAYKKCMNIAFSLFVLGLISLASCFIFLVWIGLPHLLALLYPYCNKVLSPTFYLVYTLLVAVFVFVNFVGGLSRGCWPIPLLIELPMLVLSGCLCYMLAKTDPELMRRIKALPCCPGSSTAEPSVTTHQTPPCSVAGSSFGASTPQITVVGTPVAGSQAGSHKI